MTIFISLIMFSISGVSIYLGLKTQEEIFKVSMACTALISLLICLFISPWALKLVIIAIPFVFDNITTWFIGKTWD